MSTILSGAHNFLRSEPGSRKIDGSRTRTSLICRSSSLLMRARASKTAGIDFTYCFNAMTLLIDCSEYCIVGLVGMMVIYSSVHLLTDGEVTNSSQDSVNVHKGFEC